MSSTPPENFVDWEVFFSALRTRGLPVGPGEIARLSWAFSKAPNLDRSGLHDVLKCTLVKDTDQEAKFETLFEDWCPAEEPSWLTDEQAPASAQQDRKVRSLHGKRQRRSAAPNPTGGMDETHGDEFDTGMEGPKSRRGFQVFWVGAILVVVLSIALRAVLFEEPEPDTIAIAPTAESVGPVVATGPDPAPESGPPSNPVSEYWTWSASVQALPRPIRLQAWQIAVLGALAWLLALGLGIVYRLRGKPLPPAAAPGPGPEWLPLTNPERPASGLLEARTRRQFVWNVARFLSEDLTHRLDVPATVEATARRGGSVALHREHAVYPREVWLWEDEMCTDPALEALAFEVGSALDEVGLPVRRGGFSDLPSKVHWAPENWFVPYLLEGHQQHAMVAILTDGDGLREALHSERHHGEAVRLLSNLRQWPALVFVDFSANRSLGPLAREHGLECIEPAALADWLGGQTTVSHKTEPSWSPPGTGQLSIPTRLWAAACALGDQPLRPWEAQDLRVALQVPAPAFAYRDLVADAGNRQLRWQPARRHVLINWLLHREQLAPDATPPADSTLGRALRWWERRFEHAARRYRRNQNSLLPWHQTPAQRRWRIECALLRLYGDPEGAANELTRLGGHGFATEIQDRLSKLARADQRPAADPQGRAAIYLPWRLRDQPVAAQIRLRKLGFGGTRFQDSPAQSRLPGRLALSAGLLIALGSGAIYSAYLHYRFPARPLLSSADPVFDDPRLVAQTVRGFTRTADGDFRLRVGDRRRSEIYTVSAGERLALDWRWTAEANEHRLGESLVWRAGTLAAPIRGCEEEWPSRSLVVVAASPEEQSARQLAIRLLDSGTADEVLLGLDWETQLPVFFGSSALQQKDTQLLVLGENTDVFSATLTAKLRSANTSGGKPQGWPDSYAVALTRFGDLTSALDFPGVQKLTEFRSPGSGGAVPNFFTVVAARGNVRVRGGPEERRESIGAGEPLRWVHVCPGTFTMGTVGDAPYLHETPAHTVLVSGFWITRTEVTDTQYRALFPEHSKSGNKPANLTWGEAEEYCKKPAQTPDSEDFEGRLPTEAEWEYAARAGTTTPWSFGEEPDALGDYGWYNGNSEGLQDVAGRRPNPLGLYDMHGNVWEWSQDCFNDQYNEVSQTYTERAANPFTPDPTVTAGCETRVLRGGSFYYPPEVLRSVSRNGDVPVSRLGDIGFRCVRVPAREH